MTFFDCSRFIRRFYRQFSARSCHLGGPHSCFELHSPKKHEKNQTSLEGAGFLKGAVWLTSSSAVNSTSVLGFWCYRNVKQSEQSLVGAIRWHSLRHIDQSPLYRHVFQIWRPQRHVARTCR